MRRTFVVDTLPQYYIEVVRQHQMVDQVKTDEEIKRNKTKRSTYLIRTVNCSL